MKSFSTAPALRVSGIACLFKFVGKVFPGSAAQRRIIKAAMPPLCLIALTGCATVLGGGTSQQLRLVPSDGRQHRVSVESPGLDTYDAVIPRVVSVKRSRKDIRVVVKDSADGEIAPTVVASKMNPWLMGNIAGNLPLSFLSSSIDYATGAAWKYDENATINVTKDSVAVSEKRRAEEKAKRREELESAGQQSDQ